MESGDGRSTHGDPLAFLSGGGEMGERMRSFDWESSPLGTPATWPQSLKTAVRIMLTSPQPFWIGWGDDLIKLYNDAYLPIIGGRHPWALGKPASHVWRETWHEIGPLLATAMRGLEGTYVESQLLIMERNGYPEETYYTYSYSPVFNDAGAPGGIICPNTDDTRRVIGERQLTLLRELAARTTDAQTIPRACQRSAEALASNLRDLPFAMIYLPDASGRVLTLAGSSGVPAGHAVAPVSVAIDATGGWPFAAALATHELTVVDGLEARLGGRIPKGAWPTPPTRAVILPVPGCVLVAALSPYRLLDDTYRGFLNLVAGQISTALASAGAYAQERRKAEALAELDSVKTAFFSNVSHEFRTPLTLMLGHVEELLGRNGDDLAPAVAGRLEVINRNGLRLLRLVNSLLDFSRIEAGRARAVYRPTDLAAFTADLASVFRAACERAGLELDVDCPPLDVPVFVDREMWEKIVLNLLSNAFKFTFEGRIAVTLRRSGEVVELRVRDTGTGIPAEELPRLFERFHRIQGARGRTHEGTGIGLALVQELVKLHGGSIAAESVLGRGTTFTLAVPFGSWHLPPDQVGESGTLDPVRAGVGASYFDEAFQRLPEVRSPVPSEAVSKEGDRRPIVLVAEDNADMREYVVRLLADRYHVDDVADGEAALASARARPPDLVLTDAMMPRLDGFGLLRALRSDPITRGVPIIMLSARAGEESRVDGMEAGADDYLVKPFSARELLARVSTHLQMARMRRESEHQLATELAATRRLHALGGRLLSAADLSAALDDVLENAIATCGADFGNIQLFNPVSQALEIVAHRGFRSEFLDHFRAVRVGQGAACAQAMEHGERLIIEDVEEDPAFESHRRVAAAAGFRAVQSTPLQTHDGKIVGMLSTHFREPHRISERDERLLDMYARVAADLIERHRFEQALKDADRRKDEFLATLAHELRNPLAPLRNGLAIMRLASGDPEAVAKAREMMDRQLSQMVRLVDDLLDLSRISRGTIALQRRRVRLDAIVQHAVETSRPVIEERGHVLTVNRPTEPIDVEADEARLAQVFSNLLHNAAKFTEREGRIEIDIAQRAGEAVVTVRDNGIGIAAPMLPRVFDMFTQAGRTLETSHGGLGIGLSLSKQLTESHGGSVEVRSDGPGTGSEFMVRLPLAPSGVGEASAVDEETSGPAAPRRILVVDDNEDSATSLARMLGLMGHRTRVASDGLEALELAPQFGPDVILLDIGMPRLNGYDTARRIREQPWGRSVILVALTGWGLEEDTRKSREAGFNAHMVKPADPVILMKLLAGLEATTA